MRNWLPAIGLTDFFVLVAVYSLLVVQMPEFANDPGVGWHLKTGEWIWQHAAVPKVDPFLFAASPRAWISDQWLSDLLLWRLFSVGSWPLVYAFLTVVFLITFLLVLIHGLRKIHGQYLPALVAALVAFKIAQIHFILRPVIFSFFFFAVIYVCHGIVLKKLHNNGSISKSHALSLAVFLPILFVLWANMHGAFILGLAFLGLSFLGLMLDRLVLKRPQALVVSNRSLLMLLAVIATSTVATLMNPYGMELHKSIFALGADPFFMRYHMEWFGPDFKSLEGWLLEFLLLSIFLAALYSKHSKDRFAFVELLPFLIFLHLGLQAVRVLPFLAIVASGLLVRSLTDIANSAFIENVPRLARFSFLLLTVEEHEKKTSAGLVVLSVIILMLCGDILLHSNLLLFKGPFGPNTDSYPRTALEMLNDYGSPKNPVVVAAPAEWGGYITFYGLPNVKPVIDDRNYLLGSQFYKDFDTNMHVSKDWKSFLAGLGATHLLLHSDSSLASHIKATGDLYVLHEDKLAVLFDLGSTS